MAARTSFKVVLEGRGLATLRPSDHIETGGEGSIYRIGSDMVVKIYSDPLKIRKAGLSEKIKRLARFNHQCIVSPQGLVLSGHSEPIGLYMPYVDGHPMARVFTNDFCKREGFTIKHATELVDLMRDTVKYAHDNQAVIVDGNELNWFALFDGKDPVPKIVDVDSWAIGQWPAAAIMPSIRDWHSPNFTEESDWFSWGIVTFQVFTGIHPYKGTLHGFGKNDFVERMKVNKSVFTPGVRLNRAVRDFSLIPPKLLGWYEGVFQRGERSIPPSSYDGVWPTPASIKILHTTVTSQFGKLVYEKLFERTGDRVVRVFASGIALLGSGSLIDLRTRREIWQTSAREVEVMKEMNGWLVIESVNQKANFTFVRESDLASERLPLEIAASKVLVHGKRAFVVHSNGLTEIRVHNFSGRAVVSAGQTWSALVNSAKWFNSLGVEDAMGAAFVLIPSGEQGVAHLRVRELDGISVIGAKAGNRYAAFVGVDRLGANRLVEMVLSVDHSSYTASSTEVDQLELNLAVLPKGVCAKIIDDGELIIFVPNGQVIRVADKHVATDMFLANWEDKVVYIKDGAVWSVRMS